MQKFRNEVVAFCQQLRKERGIWIYQNPTVFAAWNTILEEFRQEQKKQKEQQKELDQLAPQKTVLPPVTLDPYLVKMFPACLTQGDVLAASSWLTQRLEVARMEAKMLWGVDAPKQQLGATPFRSWGQLTDDEKGEIPDSWLLTLPRTILDQCLQDMGKTYNKAIKDRAEVKHLKAWSASSTEATDGKKPKKNKEKSIPELPTAATTT